MNSLLRKILLSLALFFATTTMLWAEETTKVSAPPEGKAQIVFMRPSFSGVAISSSVFDVTSEQNKVIGVVKGKKKFVHILDPGDYTFMVVGENADFVKTKVESGKTYYVLIQVRVGFWKARFSLVPIRKAELDDEKFAKWDRKSQWLEMDMDRWNAWANKHMKSIQRKRVKYYTKWEGKPDADKARYMMQPDDGI